MSEAEDTTTLPADPAERLRALVERIVSELGLDATVEVVETDDDLLANVEGDDLGLLIGKHGSTIDAIQDLAVRMIGGAGRDRRNVTIDAAGYRGRREEALHQSADRAASEALDYGRPVEMEPMRSLERRVVHRYLLERTDVATHSEGDEPNRRLVVSPQRPTDAQS